MNPNVLLGLLALVVVWGSLIHLGRTTALLRDSLGPEGATRSYSLARCQMAWWFGILFTSYVQLWLKANGEFPALGDSDTLSILLAISSGTGLAASALDAGRGQVMPPSVGLWPDILSDVNGITLARFQLVAWNVVIGVFFLYKVLRSDGALPPLDPSVLTLLGVSASAYVGFKLPEKHTTDDAATPGTDAPDPKGAYSTESGST